MAQACVMVQPELDCGTHQQCMLTPGRPSAPPHVDNTLITSTVRKRKDVTDAAPATEKRVKKPLTSPIAVPLLNKEAQLLSPPTKKYDDAPARVTSTDDTTTGADDEQQELFSPHFHLGMHKNDAAGSSNNLEAVVKQQSATRQSTPPLENTSTDASTGTSATLEVDVSDCDIQIGSPGNNAMCLAPPQPPQQQQEEEEDEYLDFDPFVFIKRLPPLKYCVSPRTEFLLPRQTRRSKQKTLVLDLDETLVHSTLDGTGVPDFTFNVDLGHIRHMVAVRKRPHLHMFLDRVAQLFEVVVFTASQRVYAEQLLDLVDPGRKLIRHRVYRESCVFWEGNYLKDLTVLGRDLKHTLIVDNSPQAFGFQLENGVPIESWYDDHQDEELLKLLPWLESIADADDVRPHIHDRFKLKNLVDAAPGPVHPQRG